MVQAINTVVLYASGAVGSLSPPSGVPTIDQGDSLIRRGFNTAIILGGVVSTAFIIYGGIKYITSGGDASKVKEAQAQITYAVIGLVITLVAYLIVLFIGQLIGADITGSPFSI